MINNVYKVLDIKEEVGVRSTKCIDRTRGYQNRFNLPSFCGLPFSSRVVFHSFLETITVIRSNFDGSIQRVKDNQVIGRSLMIRDTVDRNRETHHHFQSSETLIRLRNS